MRVLVLRHSEDDSPGFVRDAFEAHGGTVDTFLHPGTGPLPDLGGGYDHLVVLGSDASACNAKGWVAEEIDWLRGVQLPVLGVCFGAQLLSAAFGGEVERAPVYEVGWVEVEPVVGDAPGASGRATPQIEPGPWFEFHGDRCVPPETAYVLAQNDVCVQAFTIGPHLGVQFHPEVDTAQLRRWIANGGRKAVVRAGLDPDALAEETERQEPGARARAVALVGAYLEHATA